MRRNYLKKNYDTYHIKCYPVNITKPILDLN